MKLSIKQMQTACLALGLAIDYENSLADAYGHNPKEAAVKNANKNIRRFKRLQVSIRLHLSQSGKGHPATLLKHFKSIDIDTLRKEQGK